MALKDLVVDQQALQEEIIEKTVSPFVRYDPKQASVVFLPEKAHELSLPKRIVVYLLALKGWQYFDEVQDASQEAQPREIAHVLGENGSTVRSHLQALLKEGLIKKEGVKYSVSPIAIKKIQDFLNE